MVSIIERPFARRTHAVRPPYARRTHAVRTPYARRTPALRTPYTRRTHAVRTPYARRTHAVRTPYARRTHALHPPYARRTHAVRTPYAYITVCTKQHRAVVSMMQEDLAWYLIEMAWIMTTQDRKHHRTYTVIQCTKQILLDGRLVLIDAGVCFTSWSQRRQSARVRSDRALELRVSGGRHQGARGATKRPPAGSVWQRSRRRGRRRRRRSGRAICWRSSRRTGTRRSQPSARSWPPRPASRRAPPSSDGDVQRTSCKRQGGAVLNNIMYCGMRTRVHVVETNMETCTDAHARTHARTHARKHASTLI